MKKFLVIQTNAEGRPCAWGLSADKEAATRTAVELWDKHGHPPGALCYPGETRGELVVHEVEEDTERHVDLAASNEVHEASETYKRRDEVPADAPVGTLLRSTRHSGFKLVVVVGYPRDAWSPRLRVRVWSANSKCWSNPQLVRRDTLTPLTNKDCAKRAKIIETAARASSKFLRGGGK